jgi:hypothetical protein
MVEDDGRFPSDEGSRRGDRAILLVQLAGHPTLLLELKEQL